MAFMNLARGVTFCILWYFSIFFGCIALYCPLLPLLLFSNYAFRFMTDKIFAFWELYPTVLLQTLFGTKIYVHGDYVDPDETSLVIVNHRTRVDWNYLWLCMFHASRRVHRSYENDCLSKYDKAMNGTWIQQNGCFHKHNVMHNGNNKFPSNPFGFNLFKAFNQKLRLKYVLKDEIRHLPGPGWVMQMNCFTYIKRNWEYDEAEMARVVNYLYNMNYTYQLLIFPEGTDLSESNIKKSDSFAKKNNLMPYRQVLHPRTRGFTSLVQSLRPQLASIYDISVAYSSFNKYTYGTQVRNCGLKDIIFGNFPAEVHFLIKRHAVDVLPEEENTLAEWLNDIWREKEMHLNNFYKLGRFANVQNRLNYTMKGELIVALIFWTSLVILFPIAVVYSLYVRWFLFISCMGFVCLSFFSGGFHHLEMTYFEFKRGKKKREV